jgi:hypothetical protein
MAPDAFGKFSRAFVTMFRVTAGDTWVDGMPTLLEGGDLNQGFAVFITSYVILVVWLVLQARKPSPSPPLSRVRQAGGCRRPPLPCARPALAAPFPFFLQPRAPQPAALGAGS